MHSGPDELRGSTPTRRLAPTFRLLLAASALLAALGAGEAAADRLPFLPPVTVSGVGDPTAVQDGVRGVRYARPVAQPVKGGGSVMAWERIIGVDTGVQAAFVEPDGRAGAVIDLTDRGVHPAIAFDRDRREAVVAWGAYTGVHVARLSAQGVVGQVQHLGPGLDPSVAVVRGRTVVTWRTIENAVSAATLASDGTVVGSSSIPRADAGSGPVLSADIQARRPEVLWLRGSLAPSDAGFEIVRAQIGPDGDLDRPRRLLTAGEKSSRYLAEMTVNDGHLVAVRRERLVHASEAVIVADLRRRRPVIRTVASNRAGDAPASFHHPDVDAGYFGRTVVVWRQHPLSAGNNAAAVYGAVLPDRAAATARTIQISPRDDRARAPAILNVNNSPIVAWPSARGLRATELAPEGVGTPTTIANPSLGDASEVALTPTFGGLTISWLAEGARGRTSVRVSAARRGL